MSNKCLIVIAGTVDDLLFHHACFIAMNLARLLPNFHFKKICKNVTEWEVWINTICKLHNWKHTRSPLIWKQCGVTGTKATYIGNANKFREFLLEYYNIRSDLTREELEALKVDLLFAHEVERKIGCLQIQGKYRRVTIISAGKSLCLDLVPQLMAMKELQLSCGIAVSLYDELEHFNRLEKIIKNIENGSENVNAIAIVRDVPSGLRDCDVLIFLNDMTREEREQHNSWYRRNYKCIETLSEQINQYAPSHMRVVFCSMGPMCLCATVMQNLVTKLSRTNIVAVSAHYGLKVACDLVKSPSLNLRNFGCPPVWGFLGISQFVDVCHMVQEYDVCRLYNALKTKESASLSAESEQSGLKWFFHTARNKNLYHVYLQRKAAIKYPVDQPEDSLKCKAICDLLKLWYKEDIDDEIIALGISSDGSFGIPNGIVFSQPAYLKILDGNIRTWVPYSNFPMPDMPISIFRNLISTAVTIVQRLMNSDKTHNAMEITDTDIDLEGIATHSQ